VEADLLARSCLARFPSGSFAVVHAIEATLPFGNASSVLGVSSWDAKSRTLSAALLAPEGIALFEASRTGGGEVVVTRALPPLDRPGFAEGLFEDLAFLYFPPGHDISVPPRADSPEPATAVFPAHGQGEGSPGTAGTAHLPVPGRYEDGRSVCRWPLPDRTIDLVPAPDGGFAMVEYRDSSEPVRRFEAGRSTSSGHFPLSSRFERSGPAGYSMRFSLVEL